MTKFKSIFTGLALLLASTVIALLAVELGMRALGISFPVFDTYDAVRGIALRPGKTGLYNKEGRAYLSINREGYRDINHEIAKPTGVFRIAVLGDSFTEARQMPLEQAYWARLGVELQDCPAVAGRDIEMLNFGIGGYETSHALLTLEKDVFKYQPDAVLLGFFPGNDVQGNSRELNTNASWRADKPFYEVHNGELIVPGKLEVPLARRILYDGVHYSRVLELINEARRGFAVWKIKSQASNQASNQAENNDTAAKTAEIGTYDGVFLPPQNKAWKNAWVLTEKLLARMRELSAKHGAQFGLLTIPNAIQVDPSEQKRQRYLDALGADDFLYPDRTLSAIGKRQHFAVFPLTRALQAEAVAQNRYLHGFENTALGTGHMNSYGHEQLAKLVAPKVCGWLGDAQ